VRWIIGVLSSSLLLGRRVAAVEFQWRRLQEMATGKGRRWGATVSGGKEEDEARRLHGARGGRHSEEQCNGRGGRRRRLASRG
jgi:hypothetical protein